MATLVKYVLFLLNVQARTCGVCAWRKDGFLYIHDFVAGIWDKSENMMEYLGKIQSIFCPEQPICYEQGKGRRNNISNNVPPYLMIGNDTIYVENMSAYICCLPCSCTDKCIEDDNCCLTKSFASDTDIEYGKNIDTESINETISKDTIRSQCFGASYLNYFKGSKKPFTIEGYSMVTRCFIDKSNRSLVTKCETPTTADFEETLPVTSNTTGRTYWNKFCAICNSDSADLSTWNSTAILPELLFYVNLSTKTGPTLTLDVLKTFDDVHKRLSSAGNKIFTPPSHMAHKRCFTKSMIWSCEHNSSDIIYVACKQFYSPVFFMTYTKRLSVYMNIFCFLCGEHSLPIIHKDMCILLESHRSLPGAVTSLLDYGSSAAKFPISHDYAQHSQHKKCRCDEFLDPYQDFCRPLFCPFGELLITCRCVQPIRSIYGMPVLMKLKVTIDKGRHFVAADALMNKLHTVVTKFLKNTASQVDVKIAATLRPTANETEYYLCLAIVSTNFGYDTKETLKPFLDYLDSQRYETITVKKVTFKVRLTQRLYVWVPLVTGDASFRGVDLQDHYDLKPIYLNEEVMRGQTRRGAYQIFSPLLYCHQVQLNGNESWEQNGLLTVNTTLPYFSVWNYHRVTPNEVRICINDYMPVVTADNSTLRIANRFRSNL